MGELFIGHIDSGETQNNISNDQAWTALYFGLQ